MKQSFPARLICASPVGQAASAAEWPRHALPLIKRTRRKDMLKRALSFVLLAVLLLCAGIPEASAQKTSITPLLDPQKVKITQTQDEFLNILLLGLDLSTGVHHASGNKRQLMKAHTDVVMLVCINKTKGRIDLLSIPRDTLVNVPDVHGLYKLNAAFNTATNPTEGFRHTVNTVSWFLGGVKIDAYCAVDIAALYTMMDIIGGVDYDLEMNYIGTSGTKYKAGFQHLDAMGIVDYVRARVNATVDRNDMGRTARNRRMVIALFDKLKGDINMIKELWALKDNKDVLFYTDMKGLYVITDMWDFLQSIDSAEIGSYMISGDYHLYVLGKYNANITDQKQRIETVKTIFGFAPEEIPFVSAEFCSWFIQPTGGCLYTQNIRQARLILDYALLHADTDARKKAAKALDKAIDNAIDAYDTLSQRLRGNKPIENMQSTLKTMISAAETAAATCGYPDTYRWDKTRWWFQDPLINDYYQIDWR